ncbi:MAG: hypothetical protein ABL903_06220 [Methylococcales bacterium]
MKTLTTRLGLGALLGLIIVFVTRWKFNDFFFIDDAQNVFLPFFVEMGRIWLSGHIPILTTNTYWGGNILVDMQMSPFAPQSILSALFAAKSGSFELTADFFAWLNITLVIMGSYWLGRVLKIREGYAFLLGFMVATNQVFIYVFCASWWNYASAFAWFVVSFAALLKLQQEQKLQTFFYAFLSLCCLFASAGTQMQLAYLILFVMVLSFDYWQYRCLIRLFTYCLAGLAAVLTVAVPLMAEYIFNKDLIERTSAINNTGNFLVPSWGYVINFFNPFFHTYIHWFEGYRYLPIALGYVGVIGLLPVFFYKYTEDKSLELKIILMAIAVSLILVFSSSQLGATRWPFRYFPVVVLFMATLTIYAIDKSKLCFSATRFRYYLWGVGFFTLIQLFSAETSVFKGRNILSAVYFIGLCLLLIAPFYKQQTRTAYPFAVLCSASFLAWLGILSQTHSLAGPYLTYPRVTDHISGLFPKYGYALNLTRRIGNIDKDIADLYSAQYLLFGVKSINGYSPVGHKGIQSLFPSTSSHGYFNPQEALKNISQPAEGFPGVYDYQLMNIDAICALNSDVTADLVVSLTKAGLKLEPYRVGNRSLIYPETPRPTQGTLTYQTVEGSIKLDHSDGMINEWFDVKSVKEKRALVFSRVYWPGYHAFLNETEYPVEAYKNALVKVELPADKSGTLHLYYEPVSWRYTKWSLLLGLVLCGFAAKLLKFNDRATQDITAKP